MSKGASHHPDPHHRPGAAALGVVTVLLTLFGWSSVPLFVTHFSTLVDPWTQNGWRYAFAALLWAPALIWVWLKGTFPKGLWRAAVWPAIPNALGQTAFTLSFYFVDTATAAFGLRTQIVFVSLGAYLMFPSERAFLRKPGAWLGIALVIGGVLGTIALRSPDTNPTHAVGVHASPALGVAMAILGGLLFALYGLAVRKHAQGYHPLVAFAAISQLTALVCVAIMLPLAVNPATGAHDLGWSVWHMSAVPFAMLLVSAVIGISLGHTFYFVAISRLGIAVTSGVLQLQPFCVAIAQLFIFGIAMTAGQWVAGIVAVGGALLLLYTQWAMSRPQLPAAADTEHALGPVPGNEPVGVEAAELDAIPVETDGIIERPLAGSPRQKV